MRTIIINFQEALAIVARMGWKSAHRHSPRGIAAFVMGIGLLLEDERPMFAQVFGTVGGIAALAMANHERLKLRVDALEKRLTQREWRERAETQWH